MHKGPAARIQARDKPCGWGMEIGLGYLLKGRAKGGMFSYGELPLLDNINTRVYVTVL